MSRCDRTDEVFWHEIEEAIRNEDWRALKAAWSVWSAPDIAGIVGIVVYLGIATIFLMK